MLKSIATVSISGTLSDKLDAIAIAGFKGVEIFDNDLVVCDRSVSEIRQQMSDLGLICTCFQPFRDFEGLEGEARNRAFERAKQKFAIMNELGAQTMLLCSSVNKASNSYFGKIAEDFYELGEVAKSFDVKVGYEALAWGAHIYDHRQAWDIVKRADHPNIGLILDTFHSFSREVPVESIKEINGKKVFLVQIADAPNIKMDYLYWSRHYRCFPGQGDFDIAGYLCELVKSGYDGPLSLEIFNDRFRSWSSEQIASDGLRSLIMVEDQMKKKLPQSKDIQTLPKLPKPEQITFVEFAASNNEAEELKNFFSSIGFTHVGNHKTKQVERWQQGEVNLIINEDPKGFAYSHQLLHGASVCAIGIGVDNIERALERAKKLHISCLQSQGQDGELNMSGARAIGGTLLYFTPANPDKDFLAVDFDETQKVLLNKGDVTRIDHIAQSMPHEEFLSWVLYYSSLLGLKKSDTLDIPDPLGLVQSLALESESKQVRITLNGAAGQTLASRFVSNYFGAGVQHIAFETKDIFAVAKMMTENKVAILDIAHNYYADLKARFALDDETLARLEKYGILYDRDENGEYYQIYTRAFKKLFFLEFVERREYKGYGAANAQVRLTAQARFKNDEV